jgi:beta-N-acetylhexosaminidase
MNQRNNVCAKALSVLLSAALLLTSCAGTPPREEESPAPSGGNGETAAVHITALPSPSPAPKPEPAETGPAYPSQWCDGGIFSDYYDAAYAILEEMANEEKIGQMLLARRPREGALEFIQCFQPGGFVLFEPDFKGRTADDVIAMLEAMQGAAKIPLVIATDEEGGSVVRISRNPFLSDRRFPSPQRLYKNGGLEAVRADALEKAALFKKLGLNLNLAPVADVSVNREDFMYPRTFGQPAAETAEYVAAVVSVMQKTGISSSLKHFPGYGNNADTHRGAAADMRPYGVFTSSDFIPFRAGIAAGAETVMISHTIVECMEPGVPASLSPKVHAILREELGFTGIILTDDLGMGAVKKHAANTAPAVLAVLAGNDMLILSDFDSAYEPILEAVRSGVIPMEMIDRAVFRILAWKLARGIIADVEG